VSSAWSAAVWQLRRDDLSADAKGIGEERRVDTCEMSEPLKLYGTAEEAGLGKVRDVV
jgi:hypothetical protein